MPARGSRESRGRGDPSTFSDTCMLLMFLVRHPGVCRATEMTTVTIFI
jgi:hypothetical protein